MSGLLDIKKGYFGEFIYENADLQINTIGGKNTYHAMGGIMSVTPDDLLRGKTERCV